MEDRRTTGRIQIRSRLAVFRSVAPALPERAVITSGAIDRLSGSDRLLLAFESLGHAATREFEHTCHLSIVEGGLFGPSLQCNESSRAGHDRVHVDFVRGILVIAQV